MQEGEIIGGRFVLGTLAGQGGMGSVFRAHDRATRKPVAVKVLAQHDADAISRFDHEARILAELGHPHIVEHVAHGATQDGAPYLVMEWLEGQSLAARLLEGRLSQIDALQLVTNIASALAAAHTRGIVHRDIKPSNIFLVDGSVGAAKVLDFGLAQAAVGGARLTRTGSVIGTPGYMAPEQAQGSRGRVTARVDVFSLGALLFECLTGKPAFEGEGVMAILARVLLDDAPRVRSILPDIPEALDALVARMLSRVPEARPADGSQVLRLLEHIARGHSTIATNTPPAPQFLGDHENSLVCIVLAAAVTEKTDGESSPTLRTDLPHARWNEMQRVAARHGGVASEFPGGGLLIRLHGTDDLLTRAGRCALAVSRILHGFRVALVTGCADAALDLPYAEIVGRAIHLLEFSKRKKSATGVRIDSRTAALLEGTFSVSGPLEAPRLREEYSNIWLPRKVFYHNTPFVGRKREIDTLVDLFADGFEEGESATALVVGQVGIGKSRLAQEVLRAFEARKLDVPKVTVRPDASGVDYGLVAAWLRNIGSFTTASSAADIRATLADLAKRAGTAVPDIVNAYFDDEYDDHGRFVAPDADQSIAPADQLRDGWFEFLHAIVRWRPALVVIEDAQWADTASMDLLHDLFAQPDIRPVGVLAVARPEVRERGFGLLCQRNVQEVRLGPLSQKAARQFVSSILDQSVSSKLTVDDIAARGEGHPLFLEESIRSAIEDRASLAPEVLLAVHGPKLARLAPDARHVLRLASLVGVTFWLGAVLALQSDTKDTAALRCVFDQLVTHGIIARRRASRVPNDIEYMFAQPSVREACVATWTEEDRIRGEMLAEQWLSKPDVREALSTREEQVSPAKRKKDWR